MNKFLLITIADLGRTITGKTPSTDCPADFGNIVPFVTPSDSFEEKYILKTARFLSKDGASKLKTKILPPESILVTCIGSAMGKIAMNKSSCITNQQINSIVVSDTYHSEYVYYCLKNNYSLLRTAANGSTALPLLNKFDFDQLKIRIHTSKEIQQKIAATLSALDAKIACNKNISNELEAMAKTLYDYWFVQFDFPNEYGKPYKSSGGKMVYNPTLKREIPESWEVHKIGNVLEVVLGGTPSTSNADYWENGTINWLSSGEMASFPIVQAAAKITQEALDNSATKLMPKGTVAISITRYIRPTILAIDSCANQSVVGVYESSVFKNSFLYPHFVNEVARYMTVRTGAMQPHINKETIKETPILKPISQTLDKYYEMADPIYQKIISNAQENLELIQLRDWLLPLLMNGQVMVK